MGLTLVEYVVAVEEAFGVPIPDEAATGIRTPRALADYLLPRIAALGEPDGCVSQRIFLAFRRAIVDVLRLPRQRIDPGTRWNALLPRLGRAQVWNALVRHLNGQKMPLHPPSLTRGWLLRIFIAGAVVATDQWQHWHGGQGASVMLFDAVVGLGLLVLTRPFLRPRHATIGDTVKHMVARCQLRERPRGPTWTREEVGRVVLKLLNEQFERSDLTLDTPFSDLE